MAKKSISQREKAPYSESREIVEKGLNFKRKSALEKGKVLRMKDVAKTLSIPVASLWNYTNGVRIPPAALARKMAEYFYSTDRKSVAEFIKGVEDARTAAHLPLRQPDVLEQLDTKRDRAGELSFVSCPLPPFSGDENCFLDTLVGRMVKSGGLTSRSAETERKNSAGFDIREALEDPNLHLALGYCATVERSVTMHCWNTPFKVCLSAIVNQEHGKAYKEVRRALLAERDSREQHPLLRAFALRNDVGATYVQSLNLENVRCEPVDSLQEMADSMTGFSSADGEVPVAVLNEYTGFELLRKINGVPVMELSSRQAARETDRKKLPAYFLSIACNRQQSASFYDLMEQMLAMFLGTEVESTATLAQKLFHELFEEVKKAVPFYMHFCKPGAGDNVRYKEAYQSVLYNLGLDQFTIDNYSDSIIPWKPILKRARELVLQDVCEEATLREQIKLMVGNDEDALLRRQLREVQEALDVELKLNEIQEQYTREDRGILVRAFKNAARGKPVGLPIEKDELGGDVQVLPIKSELLRVIDGYLAELTNFYGDHISQLDLDALGIQSPAHNPAKRVTEFRREILTSGEKREQCQVILATIGKKDPLLKVGSFIIGGAFIRPYPENHPAHKLPEGLQPQDCVELLYLWTHAQYRNLGVARYIIRKAIEHARGAWERKFLVAEIFRTLNEQATYFRKQGFEIRGENPDTGRLILSRTLMPAETSL